ncbi:hypothetical protein [Nostoc sp.]|uniref:hypothetical protein n=1 Tax=Nostoc sp. TaxID=1180 RepID=UPI002FF56E81
MLARASPLGEASGVIGEPLRCLGSPGYSRSVSLRRSKWRHGALEYKKNNSCTDAINRVSPNSCTDAINRVSPNSCTDVINRVSPNSCTDAINRVSPNS